MLTQAGRVCLPVERHRVVNLVTGLKIFEHRRDSIALRHADDELVVDVAAVGRFDRQDNAARRQGAGAVAVRLTSGSQAGW